MRGLGTEEENGENKLSREDRMPSTPHFQLYDKAKQKLLQLIYRVL